MYSRIVCKQECLMFSTSKETPDGFSVGEVFGYKLKKRYIERNQLMLLFSLQDLNAEINPTYDWYVPESWFKDCFELNESAALPFKKYHFRIR